MPTRPAPKVLDLLEYEAATFTARQLASLALQEETYLEEAKAERARQRRRIVELTIRKLKVEAAELERTVKALEDRHRRQLEAERERAAREAKLRDHADTYGNLEALAAEAADWDTRNPGVLKTRNTQPTRKKASS